MRFTEEKRLALIRRLDAAYSVGGREALGRMTGSEVHLLYAEKMVDLRAANAHLREHPRDEVGLARQAKAERETDDIVGFLKNAAEKERGREPDLE